MSTVSYKISLNQAITFTHAADVFLTKKITVCGFDQDTAEHIQKVVLPILERINDRISHALDDSTPDHQVTSYIGEASFETKAALKALKKIPSATEAADSLAQAYAEIGNAFTSK